MATTFPNTSQKPYGPQLKGYISNRGFDVTDYGATGDGVTDDTAAVTSAIAAAKAATKTLFFPAGTYKITSNITIDWDYATILGVGANSILNFVGCGLVISATTSYHYRTTLRDLRINRSGTAGPALYMIGASGSTGPARWTLDNIDVKGSTGDGLEIAGAFIGTVIGSYFRETTGRGVYIHKAGAGNAGQCITFSGGEIQNCTAGGVEMTDARGVGFLGTAIEGNGTFGAKLNNCSGTAFHGNYWEANANADIIVGDSTSSNGLSVEGGYFLMGSATKTKSIQLVRANGVSIRGNAFSGFTTNAPVAVNEAVAGAVIGAAPELENYSDGTGGITALNGATKFNQTIVGQLTTAPITRHLTGFGTLDFPSTAAGGHQDLTITVTGAASGDDVTIHMNSAMPDGIVLQAWVSAANTVTVRATNVTAAAIDPASITIRARVWK